MSTCNSYLMTSKSILLLRYQVLYLSTTIIYPPYFITSSTFISLDLTRSVELNVGVVVVGTEVSGGGRGGGGIGSVSWVVPTCALVDLRVGVGGRAGVTSVTRLVP